MLKPLEKLKALIEKGARNSANDAKMIQTMHDHSVDLGASCSVSEAASFSNSDALTLLNAAVRKQFKDNHAYAWISDVYDDYLVFTGDYSSGMCYRVDYSVDDTGSVTLGTPTQVVRKVTYIEPSNTAASESEDPTELSTIGDSLLIETPESCLEVDENESDLTEASRMLKLITPGWGSSGFYPEAVLKRDGPQVFKKGTHNYIDHLTEEEEKKKPEGFVSRLGSVLTEDAVWKDDYKGHGPGLYAKAKVKDDFNTFLGTFGDNIGVSIRARGDTILGEVDGRKGRIVEAIKSAKSVDYVTVAGAGGKILDLYESAKAGATPIKTEESRESMPTDEQFKELSEAVAALTTQNARLAESMVMRDAREYAARKLENPSIKLHAATKQRILDGLVVSAPLTESGAIDVIAFNALIETAVSNEVGYLTNVGAFGQIKGFGGSTSVTEAKIEDLTKQFQESLSALD